jgi:small-conductance mechanosensitive channel
MTDFLDLILEPLQDVFHTIKQFLPNLLAMLVILIIGILVARVLRAVLVRFLTAIKFDSWSDRMGMTTLMRKGDLWAKPSLALGSILFWIMIIVALMMGMSALKIQAIDNLGSSCICPALLPRS